MGSCTPLNIYLAAYACTFVQNLGAPSAKTFRTLVRYVIILIASLRYRPLIHGLQMTSVASSHILNDCTALFFCCFGSQNTTVPSRRTKHGGGGNCTSLLPATPNKAPTHDKYFLAVTHTHTARHTPKKSGLLPAKRFQRVDVRVHATLRRHFSFYFVAPIPSTRPYNQPTI